MAAIKRLRRGVVDGCSIDVGDFLIELSLRQADLPNALKLLFEVLIRKDGAATFNPLIIHDIGFDGVLIDDRGGPFAKLHGSFRVDLVANCDDGRELVVLGVVSLAVGGSYSKISNN